MAQDLHITFKAGLCEATEKDDSAAGAPRHIKPLPAAGYIYLFTEDELMHFCWRPRSAPMSEPELDLIMVAGDASFQPYQQHGSKFSKAEANGSAHPAAVTNGRLYVLSFSSSSDRHFFWLQSKSQSSAGDAAWHSPRDLKIAEIVNKLLAGEEVDVRQEVAAVPSNGNEPPGGGGDDDDTAMDEGDGAPRSPDHHRAASGGAGAGATGGDIREEGEESREGGADGGRAAATDPATSDAANAQAAVASFLQSLQGSNLQQPPPSQKPFTTLPDLLPTSTTIPALANASDDLLDRLLSHLPPALILLAAGTAPEEAAQPDAETVEAITMSLEASQKREILTKVLRSPQFSQGLASLTMALRDGGLPSIAEALKVPVRNGGYLSQGGPVPLGEGEAVEAFLEGFKKIAEDEESKGGSDEKMEE